MNVRETALSGLLIIEPQAFADDRGEFMEAWHDSKYREIGVPGPFIQDNVSISRTGVLRGLHFQSPGEQGKLVSVLSGEVFDVAVDLRTDSPTFKKWIGITLSGTNKTQLYIPPGFAHGFLVTKGDAIFLYKATAFYRPDCEHTIRWDDPEIAVQWPAEISHMSEKDIHAPLLADFSRDSLPKLGR